MKKILVFGGTFSPIHKGHIQMIEQAKKEISFDEILLVVAKTPRWKSLDVDPLDRFHMVELVAKKHGYRLSSIEFDKEGVNYTVDTLKELHQIEEAEYYFLMGGDEYMKFPQWKSPDEISKLAHILVYPRGEVIEKELLETYHATLLHGTVNLISSSDIRSMKQIDALEEEVLRYILKHEIYFAKRLRQYMGEKRYLHSCSVAWTAKEIAEANGFTQEDAFVAGFLHDIGKEVEQEKVEAIMNQHFYKEKSLPHFAYHQFVGAYIAHVEWGQNKEVVDAISTHATGDAHMSPLAMIVYASDKIEPTRGYDSSFLIEACKKDYRDGFIEVLKENKKYLLSSGKNIHNEMTDRCMKYYLENE